MCLTIFCASLKLCHVKTPEAIRAPSETKLFLQTCPLSLRPTYPPLVPNNVFPALQHRPPPRASRNSTRGMCMHVKSDRVDTGPGFSLLGLTISHRRGTYRRVYCICCCLVTAMAWFFLDPHRFCVHPAYAEILCNRGRRPIRSWQVAAPKPLRMAHIRQDSCQGS